MVEANPALNRHNLYLLKKAPDWLSSAAPVGIVDRPAGAFAACLLRYFVT
jgi:hypothetical protein